MTPMKHMIVPPPMSAYQLELPAPANHVIFSPHTDDLAVVLMDNRIALYKFNGKLLIFNPLPHSPKFYPP